MADGRQLRWPALRQMLALTACSAIRLQVHRVLSAGLQQLAAQQQPAFALIALDPDAPADWPSGLAVLVHKAPGAAGKQRAPLQGCETDRRAACDTPPPSQGCTGLA
jgi:hypothetical protein